MQICVGILGSHRNTWDRRALRGFATSGGSAEISSICSGFSSLRSWKLPRVKTRPRVVTFNCQPGEKIPLCVSSEFLVPFLCTVHVTMSHCEQPGLITSKHQKDLKSLGAQHLPTDCDQHQILKQESVQLWQTPFSLSHPAGTWCCSVLAVVFESHHDYMQWSPNNESLTVKKISLKLPKSERRKLYHFQCRSGKMKQNETVKDSRQWKVSGTGYGYEWCQCDFHQESTNSI